MTIKTLSSLRSARFFCVAPLFWMIAGPGAAGTQEEIFSKVAEHMHEHIDQVGAIKAAVIAGRLDDVAEPANWLATHEEPASLPSVEEMRLYAARAAAATNLTTAAAAVSEIARACGACHQDSGINVTMGFSEPPSADEQSLVIQMQRHLWAADRMWAGLIGPSDAAWQQGAEILADVQLAAFDIAADDTQKKAIENLVERVRALGAQSRQAASIELRSGLYGEFLSQCANCHNMLREGPSAR